MTDYSKRVKRLGTWLSGEGIDAAVLEDWEGSRDAAVRYLTGLPGDASLLVSADGRSTLLPWDMILAGKLATADAIVPFGSYQRQLSAALIDLLPDGTRKIEISGQASYLKVQGIREKLTGVDVQCRSDGLNEFLTGMRMIKDADEIEAHREAARKTNVIMDALDHEIKTGAFSTEVDVAMFIESEARKLGAEGMSFETIVAGPERSYGIHAFPSYGGGPFGTGGMSIVDFGLVVDGYTSDITFSVLSGTLTEKQEEMISLVRNAYDLATGMVAPGARTGAIARAVDDLFATRNYVMPHSLGHGIGLDVHESPVLKDSKESDIELKPGMLVTIEPGLYDENEGGVRYENDVLVTESGAEVITTSRLIFLR